MRIRDERAVPEAAEPPFRTFADVPVGTVFACRLSPTGLKCAAFLKAGVPIDEMDDEYEGLSTVVIRLDEPDNIWFEEGVWSEGEERVIDRHCDILMYDYEELDAELVLRTPQFPLLSFRRST